MAGVRRIPFPRLPKPPAPSPSGPIAQRLASDLKTFPQLGGCRALWGLFVEYPDDQCEPRSLPALPFRRRTPRGSQPSLSPPEPCATAQDLSRQAAPSSASGTAAPKGWRYPDVTKPAPPTPVACRGTPRDASTFSA